MKVILVFFFLHYIQGEKDDYSICVCLSLSGLCWAKKTGILILGTLTLMTLEYLEDFKRKQLFELKKNTYVQKFKWVYTQEKFKRLPLNS